MERIAIIIIASLGLLIPTTASAELNYNMFGVNFAKTIQSGTANTTGYQFGISKSITRNIFLNGVYQIGSQPSGTTQGDISMIAYSGGAGYHAPIDDNIDFIVAGDLMHATANFAGSSVTGKGYDVDFGVRAELSPAVEGAVSGIYAHNSVDANTVTSIGILLELGFKVTPNVELHASMSSDSNSPSYGSTYPTQTLSFGARFYF